MKYKKYLNEKSGDNRDTVIEWAEENPKDFDKLRDSYYGVADNIWEFVSALNSFNGDTGAFTIDLRTAKQMHNIFKKLTIGKFL